MKGEEGEKTNKAIELLYKLSLKDNFIKDVEEIRKIEKYPLDSLLGELAIMERYKIPTAYLVPFQEYISTGKLETKTKQINFVGFIDRFAHRPEMNQGNIEEWYIANKQPFVKLILLGNTSKRDVHDFINTKWKEIKEVLEEQGDDPNKRVKKKQDKNKERDRKIIELSKKSNEELRQILGPKYNSANFKENLIKNILKKDEYGNIKVSDAYVKKIIYQYKK